VFLQQRALFGAKTRLENTMVQHSDLNQIQ